MRELAEKFSQALPAYTYTARVGRALVPGSYRCLTLRSCSHAAVLRINMRGVSSCLRISASLSDFVKAPKLDFSLRMAVMAGHVRFEIFGGVCYASKLELVVVLCIPHASALPGDYWILGHNSRVDPFSEWTTTTIFLVAMSDVPGDF